MEKLDLKIKEIVILGFSITPSIKINDDYFFCSDRLLDCIGWLKLMNKQKNKKNLFLYAIIICENDFEFFLPNVSKREIKKTKRIFSNIEKLIIELEKFDYEKIGKGKKQKLEKMNYFYNKFYK